MLLRGSPLTATRSTHHTSPLIFADPSDTFDTNSSDWLKPDSGSAQPTADAADRAYTFQNNPSSWTLFQPEPFPVEGGGRRAV